MLLQHGAIKIINYLNQFQIAPKVINIRNLLILFSNFKIKKNLKYSL